MTLEKFLKLVTIFRIMNVIMFLQGSLYLVLDVMIFDMLIPIYIFFTHVFMCFCGIYICTIRSSLQRWTIVIRLEQDKWYSLGMFLYSLITFVVLVAIQVNQGLNELGKKALVIAIFCFLSTLIHLIYRFYIIKQGNKAFKQPLIR